MSSGYYHWRRIFCRFPAPRPADPWGGRPLCSPLPVRPCASVSGSKIFTFPPAAERPFSGNPAGLFAPRSSLGLVPPFRGAKSSHNRRPLGALSPAARRSFAGNPAGLKNRSCRTSRCSSFSRFQQITSSAGFYSFLFFRLPASAARIAADAPSRPRYRSVLLSSPVNGPILLLSSFPPCFPVEFDVTVFFL